MVGSPSAADLAKKTIKIAGGLRLLLSDFGSFSQPARYSLYNRQIRGKIGLGRTSPINRHRDCTPIRLPLLPLRTKAQPNELRKALRRRTAYLLGENTDGG